MPCQIAQIPVSHSLWCCLRKGQLLLSWASLNFVVLVGARWFGCYDTWEKLYDNMTTPKWRPVNHRQFSNFLSVRWIWTFSLDLILHVSTVLSLMSSAFAVLIKSQMFLFVLPPLSILPPSLALCQTAASLNQLGFVWKWSVCSVVQGVSLTRLCALSRITTVCKAFRVVWTK